MRRIATRRPAALAPVAAALLACATLGAALSPRAEAGGSPETTIVVVNADSPESLRVANEYVRLRHLPATHVVAIDGVPGLDVIGIDAFREHVWKPVRTWMEANRLLDRIDTIAYSADFPYSVDFSADKRNPQAPPITPMASLTSMTYLARRVERRDAKGYLDLGVNGYYRRYVDEESQVRLERTEDEAALYERAGRAVTEKRWAEAAEHFERLLRTYKDDFVVWYNYACCLARTGKADEALAALAKAVALGYSDVKNASADPDLESLRERPEFGVLIVGMEAAEKEIVARGAGAQPAHGFSSRWAWTGASEPVRDAPEDSLDRYWLSTLLGYTGPWGNSVPEVLSCLESAAASDGTSPAGTVYVCKNGDVRSTTREPRFAALLDALEAMGRRGEILEKADPQTGILPVCKDDVIGAVVGAADFDWTGCKSRFLPGAIAEHLTSFGAVFNAPGQTKLSAFIRAGAAGSSGAVYEPYAIPMKFPAPHLHVHYAEGCSLAEAFYQSVWGPYQLLVVGDPLARPYARFARISLAVPVTTAPWSGTVDLLAAVVPARDRPVERVELWVDGRYVAEAAPGAAIPWDTAKEEDGAHEVRLVAVESHRVGTRTGSEPTVVVVSNRKGGGTTIAGPRVVALDAILSLSGRAPGAKEVQVLSGTRLLAMATVEGDAWRAAVPAVRLGMGDVSLQARAISPAGDASRSPFAAVHVDAPATRKPAKAAPKAAAGLRAEWTDERGRPGEAILDSLGGWGATEVRKQLEGKVKGVPRSLVVEGEFEARSSGLYQLDVSAAGALSIEVDGKPALVEPKASLARQAYAFLSLEAGWHAIRLKNAPDGPWDLVVLLAGDQVAAPLAGAQLRHSAR